jgi:hypothetical protein
MSSETPRSDNMLQIMRGSSRPADKTHPLYTLAAELEGINGYLEQQLAAARAEAAELRKVVQEDSALASQDLRAENMALQDKLSALAEPPPPDGYEIETDAVTFGKPSYFWKHSCGLTGWHMPTRIEAINSAWNHATNLCDE